MTSIGSINNANSANQGGGNNSKIEAIQAQIEALNSSIPDRTSTKEQKEAAIRVKEQIIKLKQELLSLSHEDDRATVKVEIKVLEEERDTIKSELASMTSVFDDKSDTETPTTKQSDYKNSIFN